MKQKSILFGCITIAGSLLLFSCSNNETAKSDTNKAPQNNTTEMQQKAMADSTTKLNDSTAISGKAEAKEKEDDEKNEKEEK